MGLNPLKPKQIESFTYLCNFASRLWQVIYLWILLFLKKIALEIHKVQAYQLSQIFLETNSFSICLKV